ncbi:MAG TPA: histidinol dehydrogenase [bacterium]|nr:histidinol dehydrogenase [bacterium]HPP29347.1 histidinol dehydrogenase [bacterium]
MKKITLEGLKRILDGGENDNIERKVFSIIEEVRKRGDKALIHFTEKFDGVKDIKIKVSEAEIVKAKKNLDRKILQVIELAKKRIERYHRKQIPRTFTLKEKGFSVKFEFSPVKRAGIYIPAGQSPLVSTVLMTVVPAYVAGVKEIYVASPPSFHNSVHPFITGVLGYLGIRDIYAVGGAQAIAAFVYGTETVPKVDVIAGPGNKYVNTAKVLLSGKVGIDTPAGPSELVIFYDGSGRNEFIAADMNAQIEHRDGLGILITTSEKLAEKISRKVKRGYWLYVKNREEAVEAINFIAPEHLQLMCRNPETLAGKVIAGAIFIGDYSPATSGDYFAGPSHVLPTGKTARFFSGLSVYTFLRSYAVISGKSGFYKRYGGLVEMLPEIEGLHFHKESLSIRRQK